MDDFRKRIEEGIKQAELNYDALVEQGFREAEAERQCMRDKGMTEEEIEQWEYDTYERDFIEPDDEPKRGVDIDYKKGLFVVDGKEYTWEDIEAKWIENENFHGRHIDAEKVKRFFELSKLANELKAGCQWVIDVDLDQPKKTQKNAGVILHISYLAFIKGNDVKRLAKMLSLSDCFSISGVKAQQITLDFIVNGVWT